MSSGSYDEKQFFYKQIPLMIYRKSNTNYKILHAICKQPKTRGSKKPSDPSRHQREAAAKIPSPPPLLSWATRARAIRQCPNRARPPVVVVVSYQACSAPVIPCPSNHRPHLHEFYSFYLVAMSIIRPRFL